FVMVHRRKLNKAFKIRWKRPPAHTAIRYILQGLSAADVEKAFREHAANLNLATAGATARVIAFDGKTLKGSFDNFNDIKAKRSARSPSPRRWCWRISRSTKSPTKSPPCKSCWRNSTWPAMSSPATRCIVKKNLRSRRRRQCPSDRSTQGQPAEPVPKGRGRLRPGHAPVRRPDRGCEKAQPPRNPRHCGV